jgi:hypothetical protein
MLAEEYPAKFGESVGRIIERPKDLFPFSDGEREDLRLAVVGVLEPPGRLVEAGLAEQPKPASRSSRASSRTSASRTGIPASIIMTSIERLFVSRLSTATAGETVRGSMVSTPSGQTLLITSMINGVSPSGSGITRGGPPNAPSSSSGARIAASFR